MDYLSEMLHEKGFQNCYLLNIPRWVIYKCLILLLAGNIAYIGCNCLLKFALFEERTFIIPKNHFLMLSSLLLLQTVFEHFNSILLTFK